MTRAAVAAREQAVPLLAVGVGQAAPMASGEADAQESEVFGEAGDTIIQRCVVVRSKGAKGKPWVLTDPLFVNDVMFARLSMMDRGLAAFVGADSSKPHPLEQKPFQLALRNARNVAVGELMRNRQKAKDAAGTNIVRKEVIDEVPPTVDVAIEDFYDDGVLVQGMVIPMITVSASSECPAVQVTPASLEYVRRGIYNVISVQPHKRKRCDEDPFPLCPVARLHSRGFVDCRWENADGESQQESFPVKHSENPEVMSQRQVEAAAAAQGFYDECNVMPLASGDLVQVGEGAADNVCAAVATDDA